MSNPKSQIEYVMRCKLPSSGGFHSGPSGDTEYEEAYRKAIFENKPEGFEVAWPTQNLWPVDKDGMTWVKLYCTDQKKAIEYFQDRLDTAENELARIRELAKQICR